VSIQDYYFQMRTIIMLYVYYKLLNKWVFSKMLIKTQISCFCGTYLTLCTEDNHAVHDDMLLIIMLN